MAAILLFQTVSFGTIPTASAETITIPAWIKQLSKFWADGDISDAEFVAAIEHLIKSRIIKSPRLSITDQDELFMADVQGIKKKVTVPSWIKNNAKWHAEGLIGDSDFARGLEFMVEEEIISSPNIKVTPELKRSSERTPLTRTPTEIELESINAVSALDLLLTKIDVSVPSEIDFWMINPGTTIRPWSTGEKIQLTVPNIEGEYFGFFIDDLPNANFAHPVRYAWIDLITKDYEVVEANWPPIFSSLKPQPTVLSSFSFLKNSIPATLGDSPDDGSAKFDISKKPKAKLPKPNSIKSPSDKSTKTRTALVIDLGGKGSENFASDAGDFSSYLTANGHNVNRISQHGDNNLPNIDGTTKAFRELLASYGAAFECDGEECNHEFFLYLMGHGYNKDGNRYIEIENADGSAHTNAGDGVIIWKEILLELKKFPKCVKIIVFIDACKSGVIVEAGSNKQILNQMCEKSSCGVTVMTSTTSTSSTWMSQGIYESSTQDFLDGNTVDHDGDGVAGDLGDRFLEMKKEQSIFFGDPQLFTCPGQKTLCSLDGPGSFITDSSSDTDSSSTTTDDTSSVTTGSTVTTPSLPPLDHGKIYSPAPIPEIGTAVQPGDRTHLGLTPQISSNNAGYLGDKIVGEVFSIDDVLFWVDAPLLPEGYFYAGQLSASLATRGPVQAIGSSDIKPLGDGKYQGSFTFKCTAVGLGAATQLTVLNWQFYQGADKNDPSSATRITEGVVYSDRESRVNCVAAEVASSGESTGTSGADEIVKEISVLVIGGNNFPLSQFFVADPDVCDSLHYHAEKVYSLEGGSATETEGECGFGIVGSIEVGVASLTQEDIDSFKALSGIDL